MRDLHLDLLQVRQLPVLGGEQRFLFSRHLCALTLRGGHLRILGRQLLALGHQVHQLAVELCAARAPLQERHCAAGALKLLLRERNEC